MRKILTVDVGGTFTKYAVVTGARSFKVLKRDKIPTERNGHEDFLQSLTNIFKANDDVEGLALSMPGLIDTEQGICISSGLLNFANGHCIVEELQRLCGVPVTVENDANCAAIAEVKSGSLVDVKDAFVLVFGSSVGGAFIHNGEIYRGAHHCAGEVAFTLKSINATMNEDNLYGKDLSAVAFQRTCAEILRLPPEEVTGEMIFKLINDNDDDMLNALYKFAHGVAVKIFNLQRLFDPQRFALGGGISVQKGFLYAVQDKIDELSQNALPYLPRPEVVACKYHNDANLLGALYRHLRK